MASLLSGITAGGITSKIEGFGSTVAVKGKNMLDSFFPPERRAELLAKIQSFVLRNPKLSVSQLCAHICCPVLTRCQAFLASNIAMTGFPMFLFALFSLTVLVFAVIVALVIGLLVAVAFTLFCVGLALLVLFPVVFFTTLVACFIFLWGLGGYYLFRWMNKGGSPAPQGQAIGDKISAMTGGKLDLLMGNARQQQIDAKLGKDTEKELKEKYVAAQENGETPKGAKGTQNGVGAANGTSNGTPKKSASSTPKKLPPGAADVKKHVGTGVDGVKKNVNADGVKNATGQVTKHADAGNAVNGVNTGVNKVGKTTGLDGATSKVTGTVGTVKGGIGGTTGLL